jgi:outer membrane protein TolC
MLPFTGAALTIISVTACQSPQEYRTEADEVARQIIDAGQREAIGHTEPFTIETPAQTLRRRLLLEQDLPRTGDASLGVDQLEPIEHWPEDDYVADKPVNDRLDIAVEADQPLVLSLAEALQVAAGSSRDYQSRKESVFQTALALDLARDEFRNTYAGLIRSVFSGDVDPEEMGVVHTGDASVSRRFESGLSLSARIAVDLAQLLRPDDASATGIIADLSATIPLLAGAGEHIVREPLTQAERDVLYALWDFERFKRTFAVGVARDYLRVLQALDEVYNQESNYRRLIDSANRARSLADEGRVPEIQVDQAKQDELRARDRWIGARQTYLERLDQFKLTLGLPSDAKFELDRDELTRLAEAAEAAVPKTDETTLTPEMARPTAPSPEPGGNDADQTQQTVEVRQPEAESIELTDPDEPGPGRYELAERRAVGIALSQRLDLGVSIGRVFDAQRAVVVAADDLRPGLNLAASYSAGEGRTLTSADEDNADLNFTEGDYSVSLEFDLPWEKTAERNAYRVALIQLERAVRNVQELEDQIKLAVRNALRSLVQAREGIVIQARAVQLAERRVDSTSELFRLGRAEIRDVLEAQESLVSAQNALTNALVSYRVTELELQRDLGVLQVNQKGLWQEYEPAESP